MLSLLHIVEIYFVLLLSLFFIYFIGKIVLGFVKIPVGFTLTSFFTLFVGLLCVVLVYSFGKSGFKTVNLLFIPVLFSFFLYNKGWLKKWSFNKAFIGFDLKLIAILSSFLFIYQLYFYLDFQSLHVKLLFQDTYSYASVLHSLKDFGAENVDYSLNTFLPEFRTQLTPYRYTDLWMGALILEFFTLSNVAVLYLILVPLLLTVLAVGFYNLTQVHTLKINYLFVSVLLLFVTIIFDSYFNSITRLNYVSEYSYMGSFNQKLTLPACFLLLTIYLWKKDQINALLFLSCLPILYAVYLPAVWGGILIYCVCFIIYNRFSWTHVKRHFYFALVILLLIGSFFTFYAFFGATMNQKTLNSGGFPLIKHLPKELLTKTFGEIRWKVVIVDFFVHSLPSMMHYLVGAVGNLVIGFTFFIFYFLLFFKQLRAHRSLLFLFFSASFIGLVGVIAKDGDFNNYQLFTNFFIAFSLFFSMLFIRDFSILKKDKFAKIRSVTFILVVLLGCVVPIVYFKTLIGTTKLDYSFINKVAMELKNDHRSQVLCFVDQTCFQNIFYSWVDDNELEPVRQVVNNPISYVLANPEVYLVEKSIATVDYTYLWSTMNQWRAKSSSHSLRAFFYSKRLKYAYTVKGVTLPSWLQKKVISKIHSNQGGCFYVL